RRQTRRSARRRERRYDCRRRFPARRTLRAPSRAIKSAPGPKLGFLTGAFAEMERLTLYGSFTSSSSYKPMLYLALARLPFSFRTVNLKYGVQKEPPYLAINRWGVVPS